jgi:hypothetical protein
MGSGDVTAEGARGGMRVVFGQKFINPALLGAGRHLLLCCGPAAALLV